MGSKRILLLGTAFIVVFTLGVLAAALASTPISSYEVSSPDHGASGISFGMLLFLLLSSLLQLFGLDAEITARSADSTSTLISLFPPLKMSIVVLGVILILGLVKKHRPARVLFQLRSHFERPHQSSTITEETGKTRQSWPPDTPESEVYSTWLTMTKEIDVNHPHSRTPKEWAQAADTSDIDPEMVDEMTAIFRARRYGKAVEETNHQRRANQIRQEIRDRNK